MPHTEIVLNAFNATEIATLDERLVFNSFAKSIAGDHRGHAIRPHRGVKFLRIVPYQLHRFNLAS
jgi:hypothetical protein